MAAQDIIKTTFGNMENAIMQVAANLALRFSSPISIA